MKKVFLRLFCMCSGCGSHEEPCRNMQEYRYVSVETDKEVGLCAECRKKIERGGDEARIERLDRAAYLSEAARLAISICPERGYRHPVHGHPLCHLCEPIRDAIAHAYEVYGTIQDGLILPGGMGLERASRAVQHKIVRIYTDGSSMGNPGPSGFGIVIVRANGETSEERESYPDGTSNLMELLAIERAADRADIGTEIHSDSQYAINSIVRGWRVKVHHDLVHRIRAVVQRKMLTLKWVRAHNGDRMNERANALAREAAGEQLRAA